MEWPSLVNPQRSTCSSDPVSNDSGQGMPTPASMQSGCDHGTGMANGKACRGHAHL